MSVLTCERQSVLAALQGLDGAETVRLRRAARPDMLLQFYMSSALNPLLSIQALEKAGFRVRVEGRICMVDRPLRFHAAPCRAWPGPVRNLISLLERQDHFRDDPDALRALARAADEGRKALDRFAEKKLEDCAAALRERRACPDLLQGLYAAVMEET